jgi:hypothetical protein
MCDYSLMALPNRLAVCGEDLVSHRFLSGSLGLTSAADKEREISGHNGGFLALLKKLLVSPINDNCSAVCIPPGARLLVRDIPKNLQKKYALDSDAAEVVFTQTGAGVGFRDAIQFQNGKTMLLQQLNEGQRIRVLSLASEQAEEAAQPGKATSEELFSSL